MGFLKDLANRVLDEVSTISPTLGEMRWEQLKKEYDREVERERYSGYTTSSNSSGGYSGTPKEEPTVLTEEEFQQMIKESCAKLTKRYGGIFEPNPELEANMKLEPDEEVYLVHDETVHPKGKAGFIITSKGIYCRKAFAKKEFTSYEELANNKVKYDNDHISLMLCDRRITLFVPDGNPRKEGAHEAIRNLYIRIAKAYEKIERS